MGEQSHRDEMNAAIKAQRERQAAQRAPAPEAEPPVEASAPEPPPAESKRSLLARLRRR